MAQLATIAFLPEATAPKATYSGRKNPQRVTSACATIKAIPRVLRGCIELNVLLESPLFQNLLARVGTRTE